MMEDSIGIFLVSAQFFRFNFLRLIIFCLQLYKPQSHISNISLVGVFYFQLLAEYFPRLTYVRKGICSADNGVLQGCYVSRRSARRAGVGQQKLQTLKDSCILSLKNFLFVLALLRVAKQSINSSISLALAIIDAKIVARQLLGLVNLVEAQTLCIQKPTQVVIISHHQDIELATFQIVAPILKRLNDS